MHDLTIAVESKIGVDLGGFFVVFVVAIWRWRKRLKFNVENSSSAPWLLSARQKLRGSEVMGVYFRRHEHF